MFGRLFGGKRGREEESELPEGLRIEVLKYNGDLFFVGSLEWAREGVYQVTAEDESELPCIEYGTQVKLRGRNKNEAIFVEGTIVGSSDEMWRIEQTKTVRGMDKRAFFRQNAKIDAMVTCANELRDGEEGAPNTSLGECFTGTIMNLSAGGAQIVTGASFEKDDWVSVFDAELVPDEEPFSFLCVIRRRGEWEEDKTKFVYGCEFLEMGTAEQDRLLKAILTLQRKEIRARRGGPAI